MELVGYDERYVGKVMGLENPGVAMCYFNSMIQALLSCSSFNEAMLRENIKSEFILEYLKILKGSRSAKRLLELLVRKNNMLVFGQQDDMHLGLGVFLDCLPARVQNMFKVKHRSYIECRNCKKKHEVAAPHETAIIVDMVNTKEEMENVILGQNEILNDYKCEKCKSTGLIKKYSIARLSEILVVILNKTRPGIKYFSPTLDFYSAPLERNLHYKVIAQVEHLGSTSGGHYYTIAQRIHSKTNKVITCLFDDDQIHFANFSPTPNTYIVLYHIQ